MKLRRLLSLLLAVILCATIALSMFACGDDEVDDESDAAEATPPDDGGEDVVDAEGGEDVGDADGGEDVVDAEDGEEAVG